MTLDRKLLGAAGERAAAAALRRSGYRILKRNYTCPVGEIDIIARRGKLIVFVEVKTRVSDIHAHPMDNITYTKKRHIVRTAKHYLREIKSPDVEYRFDVVTVVWGTGRKPEKLEHHEAAFEESRM